MDGVFPDAFIEGNGFTPFKIASEYVVMVILAGGIGVLWKSAIPTQPATSAA